MQGVSQQDSKRNHTNRVTNNKIVTKRYFRVVRNISVLNFFRSNLKSNDHLAQLSDESLEAALLTTPRQLDEMIHQVDDADNNAVNQSEVNVSSESMFEDLESKQDDGLSGEFDFGEESFTEVDHIFVLSGDEVEDVEDHIETESLTTTPFQPIGSKPSDKTSIVKGTSKMGVHKWDCKYRNYEKTDNKTLEGSIRVWECKRGEKSNNSINGLGKNQGQETIQDDSRNGNKTNKTNSYKPIIIAIKEKKNEKTCGDNKDAKNCTLADFKEIGGSVKDQMLHLNLKSNQINGTTTKGPFSNYSENFNDVSTEIKIDTTQNPFSIQVTEFKFENGSKSSSTEFPSMSSNLTIPFKTEKHVTEVTEIPQGTISNGIELMNITSPSEKKDNVTSAINNKISVTSSKTKTSTINSSPKSEIKLSVSPSTFISKTTISSVDDSTFISSSETNTNVSSEIMNVSSVETTSSLKKSEIPTSTQSIQNNITVLSETKSGGLLTASTEISTSSLNTSDASPSTPSSEMSEVQSILAKVEMFSKSGIISFSEVSEDFATINNTKSVNSETSTKSSDIVTTITLSEVPKISTLTSTIEKKDTTLSSELPKISVFTNNKEITSVTSSPGIETSTLLTKISEVLATNKTEAGNNYSTSETLVKNSEMLTATSSEISTFTSGVKTEHITLFPEPSMITNNNETMDVTSSLEISSMETSTLSSEISAVFSSNKTETIIVNSSQETLIKSSKMLTATSSKAFKISISTSSIKDEHTTSSPNSPDPLMLINKNEMMSVISSSEIIQNAESIKNIEIVNHESSDLPNHEDFKNLTNNFIPGAHLLNDQKPSCLKECVISVSNIHLNADLSVNPCDDFYQYSCGSFLKNTIIPPERFSLSQTNIINDEQLIRIRKLLKERIMDADLPSVIRAKKFYDVCLNFSNSEENDTIYMKDFISKIGVWPMLQVNWNNSEFSETFNSSKFFQVGIIPNEFLKFTVEPYAGKMKLHITQGDLLMSNKVFRQGKDSKILNKYKDFIRDVALTLGASDAKIDQDLDHMIDFEIKLAKLITETKENKEKPHNFFKTNMSVLKVMYPEITWLTFISRFIPKIDKISDEDDVVIKNITFLQEVYELYKNTSKRVISNYIIWRAVVSHGLTASSVINKLLHLHFEKLVYLFEPLSGLFDGSLIVNENYPVWMKCINTVQSAYSVALNYQYAKSFFPMEAKQKVTDMMKNIVSTLINEVKGKNFMDIETKNRIQEKLESVALCIGYHESSLDNDTVNKFYNDAPAVDHLSFRDWLVAMRVFNTEKYFSKLDEEVEKCNDVTALGDENEYRYWSNELTVSARYLQGIFFNMNVPDYMNYGAVGFYLAHFLGHILDYESNLYDKNGEYVSGGLWTKDTEVNYKEPTQCILNQMNRISGIKLESTFDPNSFIFKLIEENVLDSALLHVTYQTFLNSLSFSPENTDPLPSLKLNEKQLFWLNFGISMCVNTRQSLHGFPQSSHRVQFSVMNQIEFSEDFNCQKDQTMNPQSKCLYWS